MSIDLDAFEKLNKTKEFALSAKVSVVISNDTLSPLVDALVADFEKELYKIDAAVIEGYHNTLRALRFLTTLAFIQQYEETAKECKQQS